LVVLAAAHDADSVRAFTPDLLRAYFKTLLITCDPFDALVLGGPPR